MNNTRNLIKKYFLMSNDNFFIEFSNEQWKNFLLNFLMNGKMENFLLNLFII